MKEKTKQTRTEKHTYTALLSEKALQGIQEARQQKFAPNVRTQ